MMIIYHYIIHCYNIKATKIGPILWHNDYIILVKFASWISGGDLLPKMKGKNGFNSQPV